MIRADSGTIFSGGKRAYPNLSASAGKTADSGTFGAEKRGKNAYMIVLDTQIKYLYTKQSAEKRRL